MDNQQQKKDNNNGKEPATQQGSSSKHPGASPAITAAFASGVRKTRSAIGSLPPGSSNAKRSAKLAAQHTEQSQVPDPIDTNVSQDGNENNRKVCESENRPVVNRVNELSNRVE